MKLNNQRFNFATQKFKLISLVIKTTQTKFANVMAKKLKVWLNNKLNKRLHCTVVIKFYRVFVTELVFTFFDFKYQKHFEFPKGGKRNPTLKILEIPGGGRVIKDPPGTENPGGVRGANPSLWNHTMISEKRAQKFHANDTSLPRSG